MIDFTPKHDFLIGIDSDGCAFDTMELKHKECFIPNIINHYELQGVSKYAREAAEFVNLYSKSPGDQPFPGAGRGDGMAQPPAGGEGSRLQCRDTEIAPQLDKKRRRSWGNPALEQEVERSGDADLIHALGVVLCV